MSSCDESKCCAEKCKDDECELEESCLIESFEACKCGTSCECADCKCCPKSGNKASIGKNGVCACGEACECTICPCCAPARTAHCVAAKCDDQCHTLDADSKDTCVQHVHHERHAHHDHHDHGEHHDHHEHHCEDKSC